MFKQPLNRGTSIIAALVFAAILGGIAVTIDGLSSSGSTSQYRSAQLAQAASTQQPTVPSCSTIKSGTIVTVSDDEDAPKQPCTCEAIENNQRYLRAINYTVKADIKSGEPVAETIQSLGGRVSSDDGMGNSVSCTVTYTDAQGKQQVLSGGQSTLDSMLKERTAQVKTEFPKLIALQELEGKVLKLGPMNAETQDAVKNAFTEIKANDQNAATYGGNRYSDATIASVEQRINNYQTCGQADCAAQQPPAPTGKPVVLNPDTKAPCTNDITCAPKSDPRISTPPPPNPCTANPTAPGCPGYRGPGPSTTFPPPTTTGSNSFLQGLLGGLARGLGMQPPMTPPPPPPPPQQPQQCPSDPNAMQQQQQQYQYQMQQYNYQLQLYQQQQYQQQLQGGTGYGLGGYGYPMQPQMPMPQQPQQCIPSSQSQCQQQIPPPNPAACTTGEWRPQYNGSCVTQWHCVPNQSGNQEAKISCEPKIADAGMTVAITYSCANAKTSTGEGFSTDGKLSGSATAVVSAGAKNGDEKIYQLTCVSAEQKTSSAQCKVQVAKTSIIIVANPQSVVSGQAASIGWVTTGMKSCVVSSPELPNFTAQNAANTSTNGMTSTGPITSSAIIDLKCTTAAGGTKSASTSIRIK